MKRSLLMMLMLILALTMLVATGCKKNLPTVAKVDRYQPSVDASVSPITLSNETTVSVETTPPPLSQAELEELGDIMNTSGGVIPDDAVKF